MVATSEVAPRKPFTPVPVDWPKIRDEYVQGSSAKDLASKYKVKTDTVKARAMREKWGLARKEFDKLQPQTIAKRVNSVVSSAAPLAADTLNNLVLCEAAKLLKALRSTNDWEDWKSMESHSRVLRAASDTARKALGLDSPNGWGPGISRDSLAVRPAGLAAPHPVIDVESTEQTPQTSADSTTGKESVE